MNNDTQTEARGFKKAQRRGREGDMAGRIPRGENNGERMRGRSGRTVASRRIKPSNSDLPKWGTPAAPGAPS